MADLNKSSILHHQYISTMLLGKFRGKVDIHIYIYIHDAQRCVLIIPADAPELTLGLFLKLFAPELKRNLHI